MRIGIATEGTEFLHFEQTSPALEGPDEKHFIEVPPRLVGSFLPFDSPLESSEECVCVSE